MPDTRGIQIHAGRAYDVFFGWVIRRSDRPILDLAGVAEGDRVLDIATGPGVSGDRCGRAGRHHGRRGGTRPVAGDGGACEGACRTRQQPGAFRRGAGTELPFADGSFDVVLSRLAIHHLPSDARSSVAAEMFRVLAPGGRVVIADLASHGANAFHHLLGRLSGSPPQEDTDLGELLAEVGLADVEAGQDRRAALRQGAQALGARELPSVRAHVGRPRLRAHVEGLRGRLRRTPASPPRSQTRCQPSRARSGTWSLARRACSRLRSRSCERSRRAGAASPRHLGTEWRATPSAGGAV